LPRKLGTSQLAGLLGDEAAAGTDPSGEDVAQRLGQWLGAFDAVALRSALLTIGSAGAAGGSADPGAAAANSPLDRAPQPDPAQVRALEQDLAQVREALAKLAAPDADAPLDRRRHLELQRTMEPRIGRLRDRTRQALAKASPRLARLAALDAAMEQAFAAREQKLLAALPALAERRLAGKPDSPADAPADTPADAPVDALRQVLLAELDLRLAPVAGMIEEFRNEVGPQP
jgi:hypothetical protein